MEGQGVTNYDVHETSYSVTHASVTEFDQALLDRGIVTLEQVFRSKGASTEQLERLVNQSSFQQQQTQRQIGEDPETGTTQRYDDEDSEDDANDDDEWMDADIMEQYRSQRLEEWKKQDHSHHHRFGKAIWIQRNEWNYEVNETSKASNAATTTTTPPPDGCWEDGITTNGGGTWVIVCLTKSTRTEAERTTTSSCLGIEAVIQELAYQYPQIKFVLIPAREAIPNWANDEDLPCLFCYHGGIMQKDFVGCFRNRQDPITNQELVTLLQGASILTSGMR